MAGNQFSVLLWGVAFMHMIWSCSLASLLLIHMSYRGPWFFSWTANRLTDSRGRVTMRRWCVLSRPLCKTVSVWGGSCWRQGHPTGVTLEAPQPPALLIDVCRCACLHDNGLHWWSPLQCPSINHTGDTERTEPFMCLYVFSRQCVWTCLCVFLPFVCVCMCAYTAWGAQRCIIDGPQGGMKVWIVAGGRQARGGGWRGCIWQTCYA